MNLPGHQKHMPMMLSSGIHFTRPWPGNIPGHPLEVVGHASGLPWDPDLFPWQCPLTGRGSANIGLALAGNVVYNALKRSVIHMALGRVSAQFDDNLISSAEDILYHLGISPSFAIQSFYRQIVLTGGVPFEIRLPYGKPEAFGSMTREERDAGLRKGMESIKAGDVYTVDEVDAEMAREFGL